MKSHIALPSLFQQQQWWIRHVSQYDASPVIKHLQAWFGAHDFYLQIDGDG